MKETFQQVKAATQAVAVLTDDQRDSVLLAVADEIEQQQGRLLKANEEDVSEVGGAGGAAFADRLLLTPERLASIAADMRNVVRLPSPLGHVSNARTLPNGLRLRRVSVPFGVIGIIYEARPNVTFDVFALCFKSGNACILKGGRDAERSNRAAVEIIHEVLSRFGISPDVVALLPATHEATAELLNAVDYVDLCIPRGGKRLIEFVRDTARVPVIETGAGVVHAYFDKDGDLDKGAAIVCNAKTRRVSVCNALDCLIVHKDRLQDLPALVAPLTERNVTLYCDEPSQRALQTHPQPLPMREGSSYFPNGEHSTPLPHREGTGEGLSGEAIFGTEFMDYKMAIRTVESLDEALHHIARYSSKHSECIITENADTARLFQQRVDAACVYWNAPTSFTDGAQFGLGAEIGISTQKLGPRGPMGLQEITTYKWLIDGDGQTRP